MPVIVFHTADKRFMFTDGADWYTDDQNRLHVRDAEKRHIAVFNRMEWVSAAHREWSDEKATWMRRQEAGYDATFGKKSAD